MEALAQQGVGSAEDPVENNNVGKEEAVAPEEITEEDTEEDGEEEDEEEVEMKLLLFYVEMSSEESKEVAILQLSDLRQNAPDQLLKFLESHIDIKSDDEESDRKSEDLGTI